MLEILPIYEEEELYYPCSENKGADQLCSYCEADLRQAKIRFSDVAHMSLVGPRHGSQARNINIGNTYLVQQLSDQPISVIFLCTAVLRTGVV